jgi:hypothetical protein
MKKKYKKLEFEIGNKTPMEDIEKILRMKASEVLPGTTLLVSVKSVLVKQEDAIPFRFSPGEITEGMSCIRAWLPRLIPESRFLPKCCHSMVIYLIDDDSEAPTDDVVYTSLMLTMEKMLAGAK